MGILDTTGPDLATLSSRFATWLSDHGYGTLQHLRANDGGAGYSNATYFALVDDTDLVIRSGPTNPDRALFPTYDIPKQFHVMRALEKHSEIPVPHCRWLETDASVFGTPFYVMDRVTGVVPTDSPSYLTGGLVADGTDAERQRMWTRSVELLAAVSNVPWQTARLGFLQWPQPDRRPIAQDLDHQVALYRWGRQGSADFPEAERAIRWLDSHLPVDEPVGLQWGDARLPNIVYRDYEPICLLDWEFAAIGNPESDLAWFLLRQFDKEHNRNPADARPRPIGFASDDDTIVLYESVSGRPTRHLEFYRAFNAFKTLAWMQRFFDLIRDSGQLTAEQAEAGKVAGGSMLSELMKIVES